MKKSILLALLLTLLTGCYLDDYSSIDIEFDNFKDMASWIHSNIEYKYDSDSQGVYEYWQSPDETYHLRTGDCEDYAFLASYFLKKMGISHGIIIGITDEKRFHAYIYIIEKRMYYEPIKGNLYIPERHKNYIDFFVLYSFQRTI